MSERYEIIRLKKALDAIDEMGQGLVIGASVDWVFLRLDALRAELQRDIAEYEALDAAMDMEEEGNNHGCTRMNTDGEGLDACGGPSQAGMPVSHWQGGEA
jgi:hypothetical protein